MTRKALWRGSHEEEGRSRRKEFHKEQAKVPHQGHEVGGMLALAPMQSSYPSLQCGGSVF